MEIIKILDFGISKIALPRGKRDLVRTQMALGSPVYMSPEQIRSSDMVDARSDIWAIGCVLFELLTGVTAFDEPSLLELSAAILEREPVPLLTLRPDASQELEDVVLRCLAKNPDDRYQNIAELAIALFPFAPRRARISAERCYHTLKNAGLVKTELELVSVYPPSLPNARITAASAAMPRTTTPAALDIRVDDDPPIEPRSHRGKLIFVAVGLAAAAAGFVVWRSGSAGTAAAAPARAAELPQVAAQVPQSAPAPSRFIDLDTDAVPSTNAAAPARSGAARSGAKAAPKPLAKPARPATAKRARGGDDDLDPGF